MKIDGTKVTLCVVTHEPKEEHIEFNVDKNIAEMAKDAIVSATVRPHGEMMLMIHTERDEIGDLWPVVMICKKTPESIKAALVEGLRINKKVVESRKKLATRLESRH